MRKVLIIILPLIALAAISLYLVFNPSKKSLPSPLTILPKAPKTAAPSETFKEYADPSGFSFEFPDNLSLTNNEITDNSTYADLQLSSKDVNGSLSLKITDSKFKSLGQWQESLKIPTNQTPKGVKLGNLDAQEIQQTDRLLLAALDKGVLFTIEIPEIEKDFWMKVYNKILASFSFVAPDTAATQTEAADVSFEGEEVLE